MKIPRHIFLPLIALFAFGATTLTFVLKNRESGSECNDMQPLVKDIMVNQHLGFLSTSIDDGGKVYMYFVNNKNGEWLVLHVANGGRHACVFMRGTNWQFILPPRT